MRILKYLYTWTLSWADSKYSAFGLFFVAFIESSFFPIPPDVLLIPLILGRLDNWFKLCVICSVGSVAGAVFGYLIGYLAMESVGNYIIELLRLESAKEQFFLWYERYGVLIVLIGAFTPIPFKVITILSGAVGLNILVFILYSFVGRAGRFFLIGIMLRIFGAKIKELIEKYFDLLSILFVLLLIGGFIALKFL